MTARIHPTAIVASGAEIDTDVEVGPYSIIGPHVQIRSGTVVRSHVVIDGHTSIGPSCVIYQFASLGAPPQDKKFSGEASRLILGAENIVREYATLQPGTAHGTMSTIIGDRNLFMASSHVAHDCRVGSDNVFANAATLAGHVTIEDRVVLGGLVAIHQFVRIGSCAMIGGGAMVARDVPPGCLAQGDRAVLRGINAIGLSRAGLSSTEVREVRTAFRQLFLAGGTMKSRVAGLSLELRANRIVQQIIEFVESSKRGVAGASRVDDGASDER